MTMTAVAPLDPDALTMDAIRDGALRDRAVTVLGFARSGIALARFLTDAGARVTIYDEPPRERADAGPWPPSTAGRSACCSVRRSTRPGSGPGPSS